MSDSKAGAQSQYTCEYCEGATHEEAVRMVLWEGDRLVVVEDVPARVCDNCYEQYFEDTVRFHIDRLRGEGFPESLASRSVNASVFSFDDIRSHSKAPSARTASESGEERKETS